MIPSRHCPKKPKSRPTNHNADWKTIQERMGNSSQKKHPYFPKNCKECGFNKNKGTITNWFRNAEQDCRNCVNIKSAIEKASVEHDITAIFAKLPELSGADYIKNVRKITEMKIFKKLEKNIFSAVGKEDKDYRNLMAGAKKASNAGYKVYVLPNPKGVKSADYIFDRNGVVKMYDLKTITGQSSIGNRLNESIGQTNRVFLNLATNYNARSMAVEIKNYFETNKNALEVLIAKGKKFVSVDRIFVNDKNYFKKIRRLIEK